MKFCKLTHFVGISLAAGLSMFTSNAALSGPSVDFGNPDEQIEMDDNWLKKPVSHDKTSAEFDLVVTLGQQTYPALKDFVLAYGKQHQLKIAVDPGSCGVSSKKLRRKVADVGAFCCPPGKIDRLPGIKFHTIGVAPIALVTRPDNPVENLTLQEARDIFSGQILRWSEVPSYKGLLPVNNIQPIARLHCKKRPGHWKGLLENQNMFGTQVREVGVIPDMISNVSKDKYAIGYETLYMLDVYKKEGTLKVLTIDGMHPSDREKMLNANYPIYRTYSLTTWEDDPHSGAATQLVNAVTKHIETDGYKYEIIPASELRKAGWKFRGEELIGEPDGGKVFTERE